MRTPDELALMEVIRHLRYCLEQCATELEYVHAVEGKGHELCATSAGRLAADEAWTALNDTRDAATERR